MNTEAQAEPRGRTRAYVNRTDLQAGDLLIAKDGNHKILEVEHQAGRAGGTSITHVKLDVRGQIFRQPVYGSRVVWRKN